MNPTHVYLAGLLQGLTLAASVATLVEVRALRRVVNQTLEEVRKPRRTGPPIPHGPDPLLTKLDRLQEDARELRRRRL